MQGESLPRLPVRWKETIMTRDSLWSKSPASLLCLKWNYKTKWCQSTNATSPIMEQHLKSIAPTPAPRSGLVYIDIYYATYKSGTCDGEWQIILEAKNGFVFRIRNHLFLFFSESFVLGLLWGVLAVPDLEMLSSLRRLLCEQEEDG